MSAINKLEDHIYHSEDAHLKFIDVSRDGGLAELTREEAKTSNKATQNFLRKILSIATRLRVLNEVSHTDIIRLFQINFVIGWQRCRPREGHH